MASNTCLHDMFLTAAQKFTRNLAVEFYEEGAPVQSLTYKDVLDIATCMSNYLTNNCTLEPNILGLFMGSCLEMPSLVLGILMSGRCFVPINTNSPSLVITNFIKHTNLKYILTNEANMETFSAICLENKLSFEQRHLPVNTSKLSLKLVLCTIEKHEADYKVSESAEDGCKSIAYVLGTSGTTGQPKVVSVPHCSIIPNIIHLQSLFCVSADDKISMLSPLTFDPSLVEMFLALTSGASLILFSGSIKVKPSILLQTLFNVAHVTVMQATPSLLSQFNEADLQNTMFSLTSSLKVLTIGGEKCPTYTTIKGWIHPKVIQPTFRVFNLYGITEVSVWATCFELPEEKIMHGSDDNISMGQPLLETSVALVSVDRSRVLCTIDMVNDINSVTCQKICLEPEDINKISNCIEGFVWLGSKSRICKIASGNLNKPLALKKTFNKFKGAEQLPKGMVFRQTGDKACLRVSGDGSKLDGTQFYYVGRSDFQIKRNGKRMNLLHVKSILEKHNSVHVVHVTQIHDRVLRTSSNNPLLVAFIVIKEFSLKDAKSAIHSIESYAPKCLDSHCVPDKFVHISQIPMTAHGKVDETVLLDILRSRVTTKEGVCFHGENGQFDTAAVKLKLIHCWNKCLQRTQDENNLDFEQIYSETMSQNFIKLGGNSFLAVKFVNLIGNLLPVNLKLPNLLNILLQNTFLDVCSYVLDAFVQNNDTKSLKRKSTQNICNTVSKKLPTVSKKETCAITITRGGKNATMFSHDGMATCSDAPKLELVNRWLYNTGKCIDASPLVVLSPDPGKGKIIIGSHSHQLACLEMSSGDLEWKLKLGDRIESSACLTPCGQFVAVGCYDTFVYFVSLATGEVAWKFKTGAEVKSSPCPGPEDTSEVFVGSHDGNIYCVEVHGLTHDMVFACSLSGQVVCLDPSTGSKRWEVDMGKPVFSSPTATETGVCAGCVDCKMYMLSHVDGSVIWTFNTQQPVFSSPAVGHCHKSGQTLIYFGSHDGYTYCLESRDGKEIWKYRPDDCDVISPVYSSPFPFEFASIRTDGFKSASCLLATASTDGTISILDANTGRKVAHKRLPGDIFSSPVVVNYPESEKQASQANTCGTTLLAIGCRDDRLYTITIREASYAHIGI